jgi:hypothetical protein
MKWEKAQYDKESRNFYIPTNWLYIHYYEALNILFRFENSLRVFVYIILKNKFFDIWTNINIESDDSQTGTINSIAKKRIKQDEKFAYLGYSVSCPLMFLTSGELIRIISNEAYWPLFNKYFKGDKEIIKNKLDEIGKIRNSLAHFRPIVEDDVELLKQNVRHVLSYIESCLVDLIKCSVSIPSNTEEDWYKEIKSLGTDLCTLSYYQNLNKNWIKIYFNYNCPIIDTIKLWSERYMYKVLNVDLIELLNKYSNINKYITYLSEKNTNADMKDYPNAEFRKSIQFCFNKECIANNYKDVVADFKSLLEDISIESELIINDKSAEGIIIKSVSADAYWEKPANAVKGYWTFITDNFDTKFSEKNQPEFWGKFSWYKDNFVPETEIFPWMPVSISEDDLPF